MQTTNDNLAFIIRSLNVPKVLLRYIMMQFVDLKTIKILVLNVKEMNVLDNYSKILLKRAQKGIIWVCERGYMDVAQWLYSFDNIDIYVKRYNADNADIFILSCKNGHCALAKWLYSIDEQRKYDIESAFLYSCRQNHLDIAQWIHSLNIINFNSSVCSMCEYNGVILSTIKNGHLIVSQWLCSIINPVWCFDFLFDMSCRYNRLAMVKWFCSIGANIHVDNEYAFRLSCKMGHITIAQWLYSIGVDIHACNDYAFRLSCEYGQLAVAKWLYSTGNISYRTALITSVGLRGKILQWLKSLK